MTTKRLAAWLGIALALAIAAAALLAQIPQPSPFQAGGGASTNQNIRTIGASFGSFNSGATALSASQTQCVTTYTSGTITAVQIDGDASGSATIDVQTVAHSSWTGIGSVSSIAASDIPALSSAAAYTDTTLTGWTKTISAGTDVCFVMTSPTTVKGLAIALKVTAN